MLANSQRFFEEVRVSMNSENPARTLKCRDFLFESSEFLSLESLALKFEQRHQKNQNSMP